MTAPGDLTVHAPFAGRVIALREVPDEVFAPGILGPGLAIWPALTTVPVCAPIAGTVASWHPHACGIESAGGPPILLHLGLDTVNLRGAGYSWRVGRGAHVGAGQLMAFWDLSAIDNHLPVTPVVAMAEVDIERVAGAEVAAGDPLFTVRS